MGCGGSKAADDKFTDVATAPAAADEAAAPPAPGTPSSVRAQEQRVDAPEAAESSSAPMHTPHREKSRVESVDHTIEAASAPAPAPSSASAPAAAAPGTGHSPSEGSGGAMGNMPPPGPRPKYQRKSQLGRGAFGTVYRVATLDGTELAEKAVRRPKLSKAKWTVILREAQLWSALGQHPNIVELIEFIEGEDELQLITKIMAAGELMDTLAAGEQHFSEAACRLVTVQVAAGLAHLHKTHSIAHCDIKPANLLCEHARVTEPGCVKLCDFGSCQRFASATAAEFERETGTLEYSAPELVENALCRKSGRTIAKYGAAVDCWSLGCVVYELIYGEPPYFSKVDDIQIQLIQKHELKFAPEVFDVVSSPTKGLIRLLLEPEPSMRVGIEEALRHPWLAGLDVEGGGDGGGMSDEERKNLERALPGNTFQRRKSTAAARAQARARLHSLGVKVLMGNLLAGGSMLDSGRASRRASGLDSPSAKAPAPAVEFDPRSI